MGEGEAIVCNELNHASIIDGCRLSKAVALRYKPSDMADLAHILRETDGKYRRRLSACETPITPVIAGDEVKAMRLSDRLMEEGVFVVGRELGLI